MIFNTCLIAQDIISIQNQAGADFQNLKEFMGSDDVEVYKFDLGRFENKIGIEYSVGREIPYPGTNDVNTAYNKGLLLFANIVKVKMEKKKIVLSFNSNGYNGASSYMGSGWKSFTKYKMSFQVKDKEKRKELIEVFKVLMKHPFILE